MGATCHDTTRRGTMCHEATTLRTSFRVPLFLLLQVPAFACPHPSPGTCRFWRAAGSSGSCQGGRHGPRRAGLAPAPLLGIHNESNTNNSMIVHTSCIHYIYIYMYYYHKYTIQDSCTCSAPPRRSRLKRRRICWSPPAGPARTTLRMSPSRPGPRRSALYLYYIIV